MLIKILEALDGYTAKVENGAIIITPSEKPKKYILEDKEYILEDKELVWCWDNEDVAMRQVKFYDAKNGGTFSYDGKRRGCKCDQYAKYEGEYPQWAKDAFKLLED